MDKNGTFFRGVSFEEEEEEEEEEALFCVQTTNASSAKRLRPNPTNPTSAKKNARARERERERERRRVLPFWCCRASGERKKASLSRDQITTISSESSFRLRNVGNISRDPVQKNHNHHHLKKKISLLETTTTTTGRRRRRRRGVVDENDVSDFGSDDDDDVVVGWVCRTKTPRLCEGEEETNKYTQRGAPRFKRLRVMMVRKEEIGHESVRQPRGRSDDERRRKRRRRRRRKRRKGATRDRLVQVLWKKIVTGCGRE